MNVKWPTCTLPIAFMSFIGAIGAGEIGLARIDWPRPLLATQQ
jgi:hypothetical protein